MNELVKKYLVPVKDFWVNLPSKKKKIALFCLAGILLISVVLVALMNRTQYTILYPGLDHDEAVEVMTELKNRGVSYKEDNGTIYVPTDKENSLRMDLSNEGHPKTAPNYDFFTSHIGVMTTDYEKKIIEKYQMNERLASVIKTLDPIENALVTINIADQNDYAWDEKDNGSTASVTVKIKDRKTLEPKQVNGIKQLVAKSLPDLTADNVAVIDESTGEELESSDSNSSDSVQMDLTEFKLKIEKQYEDNIEKKIKKLLSPTFGDGNTSVSVKSQMDLDKKIQDIITYQPTTSDGKGIVSQSNEQHEETVNGDSDTGGVAGAENNSDTNGGTTTYPGVTVNGNTITTKDNKTYNYLVSQVQEQVQSDAGAVEDLSVSVIINSAAMTDQQKSDLTALIANASGADESKVAVVSSSFASAEQPVNTKPTSPALSINQIIIIAGASLVLLIALAVLLILARRRKKRARLLAEKLGQPGEIGLEGLGDQSEEAIPEASIQELRDSANVKEEKVKKELQDFSSQNPEIAAQLIRSWLRGEDDNG